VLLAERRDPTQGALLRHWLQQAVVPAFSGRILAVERCSATALVHSLVVDTRNLAAFEATGVRTPPTVLLLCL
jgi:toxin FitB